MEFKNLLIIVSSILILDIFMDYAISKRSARKVNNVRHTTNADIYDVGIKYFEAGDFSNALKCFETAYGSILSEQSDVAIEKCLFNIGLCHYKLGDYEKAVEYWKMSAERGDADAQSNLAMCFYSGTGIKKNYTLAAYLWIQSAEQGNPTAQYNLGGCYRNGTGVEQDLAKAVYWYEKASEQGMSDATDALRSIYKTDINNKGY